MWVVSPVIPQHITYGINPPCLTSLVSIGPPSKSLPWSLNMSGSLTSLVLLAEVCHVCLDFLYLNWWWTKLYSPAGCLDEARGLFVWQCSSVFHTSVQCWTSASITLLFSPHAQTHIFLQLHVSFPVRDIKTVHPGEKTRKMLLGHRVTWPDVHLLTESLNVSAILVHAFICLQTHTAPLCRFLCYPACLSFCCSSEYIKLTCIEISPSWNQSIML